MKKDFLGLKSRMSSYEDAFSDLPVKTKLTFIIILVSAICTFTTITAFSFYGVSNIRKQIETEMSITSSIITNRVHAALTFGNNSLAVETLNSLNANRDIDKSCVYNILNGEYTVFTKYFAGQISNPLCPKENELQQGIWYSKDHIHIYNEILDNFDGSIIGGVYIASELTRIDLFIINQTFIGIIVLLFVVLLGFIMARRLQKLISNPIHSLMANHNSDIQKYVGQSSEYFNKSDEIAKVDILIGSMLKKMVFLEEEAIKKNQELKKVIQNSEATFQYLSNELRQPLEATCAFSDIISSKQLGNIDDEYLSYYNDTYMNVFYFYGIANDTMEFYKNHLKATEGAQIASEPKSLIENAIKSLRENAPDYLKDINFQYNISINESLPMIYIDHIVAREITANIIFILNKYITFTDSKLLDFRISLTIDNNGNFKSSNEYSKIKIDFICDSLENESISHILENHRVYQNDVHLLRSKLQYLKHIVEYGGGTFDYGGDLRYMNKITVLFPLASIAEPRGPKQFNDFVTNKLQNFS